VVESQRAVELMDKVSSNDCVILCAGVIEYQLGFTITETSTSGLPVGHYTVNSLNCTQTRLKTDKILLQSRAYIDRGTQYQLGLTRATGRGGATTLVRPDLERSDRRHCTDDDVTEDKDDVMARS